jgi:hypothetical protein
METKTITTKDIEQVFDAITEAMLYVSESADEGHQHPLVRMLQDAMDTLDYVSM